MPATLLEFKDGNFTSTEIEPDMTNDSDALLSDLLSRWHRWSISTPPDIGYYKQNATCKFYRASRQHDDTNGARDSDAEASVMEAVDFAIEQLEQPWRTAVQFNARNLATGITVWISPRLPADDIERAHLLMHARAKLLILLEFGGVA